MKQQLSILIPDRIPALTQLRKKHQEILKATQKTIVNIAQLAVKFDAIPSIWQLVSNISNCWLTTRRYLFHSQSKCYGVQRLIHADVAWRVSQVYGTRTKVRYSVGFADTAAGQIYAHGYEEVHLGLYTCRARMPASLSISG